MQLTLLHGYPDNIGRRLTFVGYGNGPKSYVQVATAGGGDKVTVPRFQFYIDAIGGGLTVSKTYYVQPYPSGVGPRQTWALKWVVTATNAEAGAGIDLSAEQVQLAGLGGQY